MDSAPVYQLIQEHFIEQIETGKLSPGSRLPPEKTIAKQFDTSRATVQNAMAKLVHEGRIEKRVGSGTFVSEGTRSASMEVLGVTSFEEEANRRGQKVDYHLISISQGSADRECADSLEIDAGSTIIRFERLRLVGHEVIGLERRTFSKSVIGDLSLTDLHQYSTHELVELYCPEPPGGMEASIRAVGADDDLAQKLGLEAGAPLLRRNHRMFGKSGKPLLLGEAFYCEPFALRYHASAPDFL